MTTKTKILIGVGVLAVVGVGAYLLTRNKDSDEDSGEEKDGELESDAQIRIDEIEEKPIKDIEVTVKPIKKRPPNSDALPNIVKPNMTKKQLNGHIKDNCGRRPLLNQSKILNWQKCANIIGAKYRAKYTIISGYSFSGFEGSPNHLEIGNELNDLN